MSIDNCTTSSGYRVRRDLYLDEGLQARVRMSDNFTPDFYSRDTIQIWDISGNNSAAVRRWVGATLKENSLHGITIVNNGIVDKQIVFDSSYYLEDETDYMPDGKAFIVLGPGGSAHFYATGIFYKKNLQLIMRKGSQDDRRS